MIKANKRTLQQLQKLHLDKLQRYVRLKAADDNGYVSCVTCGVTRQWNERMQGGHFIKRGKKRWAYEEENVHPQCAECNGIHMQYGQADKKYTLYMVDMYGRDFVDHMLATVNEIFKPGRCFHEDMIAELDEKIKHEKARLGV